MIPKISQEKTDWLRILGYGAVLAGVFLRAMYFIGNDSFFRDEASLIFSVSDRSVSGLLDPLAGHQIAPFLYTLVLKLIAAAGYCSELCFRSPSFLAGLLTLAIFRKFALDAMGNCIGVLLSISLFAVAYNPILYSSLAKPYSIDILVSAGLIAFAHGIYAVERPGLREIVPLVVLCGVSPWLSYPSVFVVGAIAAAFFLRLKKGGGRIAVLLVSVLLLSLCLLYSMGLLESGEKVVYGIWSNAFAPLSPSGWYAGALLEPLDAALGRIRILEWGLLVFCALGMSLFWKEKKRFLLCISVLPIVFALLASMLQKYPFQGRMLLFSAPGVFLLLARGFEAVAGGRRGVYVGLLLFFLFSVPYAAVTGAALLTPSWGVREAVKYAEDNSLPGDVILADSFAAELVMYYSGFVAAGDGRRIFYEIPPGERPGKVPDPGEVVSTLPSKARIWLIAEASGYIRQKSGRFRENTVKIGKLLAEERVSCGGYSGDRARVACYSEK